MHRSEALNLALPVYLHAHAQPHRPALVVDEERFTYAQLAQSAGRVAGWLRERFAEPNLAPRVGILAGRSYETYAGILGTCWAGGTYVPLNPKLPVRRLKEIVERGQLHAVIADRRGAAHLPEISLARPLHILTPQETALPLSADSVTDWSALKPLENLPPPVALHADHPAYIIFTSGTTGIPKGVAVSVGNVVHFLACMHALHHLGPEDRVAQYTEISFDVSVSEMFACWQGGAALFVVPEPLVMGPAGFFKEHGITFWMSVPSAIPMMQRMRQVQPGLLPALRVSIFGGESFDTQLAKKWQAVAPNSIVYNLYGPTEATVACFLQRLTDPPVETPGRGTLAIGRPYAGTQAAIIGPSGDFLQTGEVGELAISGPQVALGYFEDDDLTARCFRVLDHPIGGKSRWYLTGDLAFRDAQDVFHCLGRIDHQVKVMGHRIELEEVEAHLRAVCRTQSAAAVAWPVVDGLALGIVGFVAGGGSVATCVWDELRQRMPTYMVPKEVRTVEVLPLSNNGKVDRVALRKVLEQECSA